MFRMFFLVAILSTITFSSMPAQSALLHRGNGMVYDTVLDVTWLMDANYAKTSGYHGTGHMSWGEAMSWASQLQYGGVTGWRLARVDTTDPTCSAGPGYGHHCRSTLNELGYMLYVNLRLRGYKDENDVRDLNWSGAAGGLMQNSFIDPSTGKAHSIDNLLSFNYWSSQLHQQLAGFAWYNGISPVSQNAGVTYSSNYAWAVIDGDVAPAPVSAVGAGILALLIMFGAHSYRLCNRKFVKHLSL